MAAANGVRRVWVGKNTLLSTPAVSAVIRERSGPDVRSLSLFSFFVVIFGFVFFFSWLFCLGEKRNDEWRETNLSPRLQGSKATGGFILTASHNPGGPTEVRYVLALYLLSPAPFQLS